MSPSLFRFDEAKQWLRFASEDMASADQLFRAYPPLLKQALFHCQQTVEKALKGFLVYHDQPFRKTHALVPISDKCVRLDPTLENVVAPALDLTRYAIEFRYPGELEEPTVEETMKWLAVARTVLAEVAQRLPQEPQSSVGSETES
jgi:HEPN domain-containing protein